jgi:uncharacterized membrane protein YphA (DoxX/SURF4 family)
MSALTKIEDWGNSHRAGWLDYLRIALGLFITYKGVSFVSNIEELKMAASGINLSFLSVILAHYVVFAHTLGGPLIVFGLFTRFVCLAQLPILIGAVFLVDHPEGFLSVGSHFELEIAILVLAGLIVFMVFGAGRLSLDERRRKDDLAHQE